MLHPNDSALIDQSQDLPSKGGKSVFPLVSVIISNYNYARFLRQAIASVLNQSYPHIEIIMVDDGSTDNSQEIIESYGNLIIPILQPNTGQESTVNAGFERSTGDIICFLDADDYFHPEKLAKIVQGFLEHPEWVQIGHCHTSVDAEDHVIGRSTSNILSCGNVKNLLLKWGRYASAISSGLACRRSLLEQVMPLKSGWGIDTYLNVVAPFYGEVGGLNESLMCYRMHGNNMRAYNDNLDYLIQQREATAHFINATAAESGVSEQFDIQNDADYRSYQVMQRGTGSAREGIRIIILSLRESGAIGRGVGDTLTRLLYRAMGALFPQQGKQILRLGLRGYARFQFARFPFSSQSRA
ncbi:MAG: glycosyltransferase family 2 protein [Thermosynechococcaceae cyanobacterium]